MQPAAKYVINIWLTAAIVGATLFYWGTYLINYNVVGHGGQTGDRIAMYLLTLLFSLVLSIPALMLLGLLTHALLKTRLALKTIKLWLALICVLLCILTFGVFSAFSFNLKDVQIICCYLVPLVAGVFLYKLR